ncbi:M12 family metallopeptidase [Oligoflexus tunisiensis]|uniref:M12 family metallopeptidase n=1 Tax=Oligoflexus tunisiensis TaxID=708132 RepID=UPI00159F2DA1|nr:M12 family metallopeptidase [Oligoflexus tunisiensis]
MIKSENFGHFLKLAGALVLFNATTACNYGEPQVSDTDGYVSAEDDRWIKREFNVCVSNSIRVNFLEDDSLNELAVLSNESRLKAIQIISAGLNEEFGKIGFRFHGFNDCDNTQSDIAMTFVKSEAAIVDDFGSRGKNVAIGINAFCQDGKGNDTNYLDSNCLHNVALHEFGHLLGLHHEMNRRDNDERCPLDQTTGEGEWSSVQIGHYDDQSVMNYCRVFVANYRNHKLSLSQGDINTLNAIYGGIFAQAHPEPGARLSSLDDIDFQVTGSGVTAFDVKFGRFESVDCDDPSGYIQIPSVDQRMTGDFLKGNFLSPSDNGQGNFRICLIGRSLKEAQDYKNYTSIDVFAH